MRETTITSLPTKKSSGKKSAKKITAEKSVSEVVCALIESTLKSKGGQEIVTVDLRGKTDIADYMIVASGTSTRNVMSLAEHIVDVLRKVGINPLQKEGEDGSEWVVIDNPLVVVHIFHPQTRAMYNLEKMWQAEFHS